MKKFKAICLLSGGKDSVSSLFYAQSTGFEVNALIIKPIKDSFFFHYPNTDLAKKQCELMDISYKTIELKDNTWERDLFNFLKNQEFDAIFTGAIESDFQRLRFEKLCNRLGVRFYSPFWRHNLSKSELLDEMYSTYEIIVSSVSAQGLGEKDVGKRFDKQFSEKLKKLKIHPFLEGGEAETLVVNAPFFKKRMNIEYVIKKTSQTSYQMHVLKTH